MGKSRKGGFISEFCFTVCYGFLWSLFINADATAGKLRSLFITVGAPNCSRSILKINPLKVRKFIGHLHKSFKTPFIPNWVNTLHLFFTDRWCHSTFNIWLRFTKENKQLSNCNYVFKFPIKTLIIY